MEKVKSFLISILDTLKEFIDYLSKDNVTLSFIILTMLPIIVLRITSDMLWGSIRGVVFDFAIIILISTIGYRLTLKSRKYLYTLFMAFTYITSYINIVYFRYYSSYISISLFKQLSQLDDVSDGAATALKMFDILFFGAMVISIVVIFRLAYENHEFKNKNKDISRIFIKVFIIIALVGVSTLRSKQYVRIYKMWNRPYVAENFGLYTYHTADFFKSLNMFMIGRVDEDDYQTFLEYFAENEQISNEYTGMFEGKNVIVIHAESLENFLINYELEGREITPNFNELANNGYYFSNMYSQESVGTSSDSEFVFNTSLLPVNYGTIFLTHFNNTYVSTPGLLKEEGYTTFSLHGNNGSFWNRNVMHKTLGFDFMIDKSLYNVQEEYEIGLGLSDEQFFNQSVEFLKSAKQPYYSVFITLTNHTPFAETDKYVTYDEEGNELPPLACGKFEDENICNYFKSVNYADWAFGEFIDTLEEERMLDETVIVIYGDHPANLLPENIELVQDKTLSKTEIKASEQVPFIIYSKDIEEPKEIKTVMGMIDAAPTLQNMLGIYNPYALGNDIFNMDENMVIFNNGDWTDGNIYYDEYYKKYVIINENISDEDITKEYINERIKYAEEYIDMSNIINNSNMLRYHFELIK